MPSMTIHDVNLTGRPTSNQKLEGHAHPIFLVAFSPDGKLLVSVSDDGKVWNLATGKQLRKLEGQGYAFDVAFSPDGELLASASTDGKVRLWNPLAAYSFRKSNALAARKRLHSHLT